MQDHAEFVTARRRAEAEHLAALAAFEHQPSDATRQRLGLARAEIERFEGELRERLVEGGTASPR